MARERKSDGGKDKPRRRTTDMTRRRLRDLEGLKVIDPRNYDLLRKCTTEQGKILPARYTGATPKQQRQLKRAIRRAREVGMVS